MTTCRVCEQEYDPRIYGAGPVYCSGKCRYEWQRRKRRGPNWQRVLNPVRPTRLLRARVLDDLIGHGLHVRSDPQNPYRIAVNKGGIFLKLQIGNSTGKNGGTYDWSDAYASINKHGRLEYGSSCRKIGGNKLSERAYGRKIRRPCGQRTCNKCTLTAWLVDTALKTDRINLPPHIGAAYAATNGTEQDGQTAEVQAASAEGS